MRHLRGAHRWFARATFTFIGVLIAASVVLPAGARGEGPPKVAALPTAVMPPADQGKGALFGGTRLIEAGRGSVDLEAHGYVEEEFLVTGTANVYQYGADGVEIKTAAQTYTTRIYVIRPRDPRRFSGTVQVDMAHPAVAGNTFMWSADYVLATGNAFVNVLTRRGSNSGVERVKAFDPVRYAPVNFTEAGLTWDIICQVGRLLKTKGPLNPLNGLDVRRLYAQGWSGAGAVLLFYISDGFHNRVRMPDGSPIYDGYLVGEPSGYPLINSTSKDLPENDPRQKLQPRDVPAIALHSRPQEAFRHRPDGNAPNDRYRVYEVAGSEHGQMRRTRAYNQPASLFEIGSPMGCTVKISRFPLHYYYQSTMARIAAWAERGVTPPPTQRIAVGADGTPQRDEHGNVKGGVRSANLDVPTARYYSSGAAGRGGPCAGPGYEEPFPLEKLVALYGNRQGYVSKAVNRANELERGGWLLPADAKEIRDEVTQFQGFGR